MQHETTQPARRQTGQNLFLAAVLIGSCLVVGYLVLFQGGRGAAAPAVKGRLTLADIPFNGERAFGYLQQICALGPRPSGTPAMQQQQTLLAKHFQKLGGEVALQKFRIRHPQSGEPVSMANLIVHWHPERQERILLMAHYDTRPFPDRDPRNPRGTFVGANDGGSGTAILMELAHSMAKLPGRLGVDFLLVDGEEFVFSEGDPYFIGTEYFATTYANEPHTYRYRYGVLLDLVGDADLQIYPDGRSMSWEDTRPLVQQIWETARRLGVTEFSMKNRYDVLDDHVKMHEIAKFPICDIIDFNYPYWHTQEDTPERCSPLTLAKVGWVMQEWLKSAVRK
jgi:glutaminyl-peptide cyclotransferase